MGAKYSLSCFRSPKQVVKEYLNKLQEKCNTHDNKESSMVESAANVNLGTPLEMENTMEVITVKNTQIKNKQNAPKSRDATEKPLEEGGVCNLDRTNIELFDQDELHSSSQTINHEALMDSDLNSVLEMEHHNSLENMGTDMMRNNMPSEINLLDLNMVTGSLQAREGNQMEMTNYVPLENDVELIEDDDPTTLLAVQDSPVGHASPSSLHRVYSSTKMKKTKKEWIVGKDKVRKALSTSDLLHENLAKMNADELTTGQIERDKCNSSEEVKSAEAFCTECKEEAFSLPPGNVVKDVTSLDSGGHSISVQVLDNPFMDISVAGCGDEELPSTGKNMKKEVKSTVHAEFVDDSTIHDLSPCYLLHKNGVVVPDCGVIVEMSLESCSKDCLNEAKNNIENSTNKQDKLLEASMSLEGIPVNCTRRKLLILDVNGLLVDIVQFQPNWRRPDKKVSGRSVYKRPFCDDFLKFCFDRFDVGIWSSRIRKNLLSVLDFLIGEDKNKLLFFWDQSHCTITGLTTIENRNKPLFLKELKKLWDKEEPNLPWEKGEYTPSNTLLLDDSPYKALRNPPYTAIFPRPYNFQDENDDSLGPGGDLRVYLEGLAKSDDVPRYVQEHPFGQGAITSADPSWSFYLNVIGVEHSSAPAL